MRPLAGPRCLIGLLCLLLTACASREAPSPPLLTLGPSSIIIGDVYLTDDFITHIPQGWRVITGQALSPAAVTFVAPDGCWLIFISADPTATIPQPAPCESAALRTDHRALRSGSRTIIIGGSAPADQWSAFLGTYAQVIAATRAGAT